jgi:acetyl esterase/lipase
MTRSASLLAAVTACAILATSAGPAAARTCTPASAPQTSAYARIAGVPLKLTSLDVWAPTCRGADRRAPVVVWVHGGGYQVGDKRNGVPNKVRLFNERGWIFVSVNYRLTRPADPASARYPDHFRDVAAAVAWVRSRIARWSGNPRQIALLGHSAGADIVSNVTVNPAWLGERGLSLRAVRCAAPLDTEGFDKTRVRDDDKTSIQWRLAFGNNPSYKLDTSATLLARRGRHIPSTFTVFRGLPLRRSIETAFRDALVRVGVRTRLVDASSLTHGQVNSRIGAPGDTVMTRPLMSFLRSCLRRG